MKKKPRGMGRIFLQPGSANWWLQYYIKGPDGRFKLVRESSGSTKQSDAVALLKKRTGQINAGILIEPSIAKTTRLSDLKKLVEDDYTVNDFRTASALKGNFGRLTAHFGDVVVSQITSAEIERFKAEALKRYKPASINRSLSALKRGLKLARRAGLVVNEPIIDMLREDNARQGFLDHDQFQRLRDELPSVLRDPITFLYLSGWRTGEMKSLEWQDVDLPNHNDLATAG